EAGAGVEARDTQPVDRSVARDERGGLAVTDQRVLLDTRGHRGTTPVCRLLPAGYNIVPGPLSISGLVGVYAALREAKDVLALPRRSSSNRVSSFFVLAIAVVRLALAALLSGANLY